MAKRVVRRKKKQMLSGIIGLGITTIIAAKVINLVGKQMQEPFKKRKR
jgi:hypothetical protein